VAAAAAPEGDEFAGSFPGGESMTGEQRESCHGLRRRLPVDSAGTPAEVIVRFLRATNFSRDANGDFLAEGLLSDHLRWRKKWRPESITLDECRVAMSSGVVRFLGLGRQGHPVLWIQASLWNPQDYAPKEMTQFVTFWLVQAEKIMRANGTSKVLLVFDVGGWSLWMAGYLSCVHLPPQPLS